MLRFERNLKRLLTYREAHPRDALVLDAVGLKRMEAEALHGLGLIGKVSEDLAGNCTVTLAPAAFSYFEDRRRERRAFWREFFSKFVSGVFAGAASTLLVTYLTGCLIF